MHYLKGEAEQIAINACSRAAELAGNSNCRLARHGVVIVRGGAIIGKGWNTPVPDEPCDPCLRVGVQSGQRYELCRAIHAEQKAILDAGGMRQDYRDSVMYHARIDAAGNMRPSNDPSCTPCSRLIKHIGIEGFVLFDRDGYVYYPAEEFNRLSYGFHDI
ncbi:hypothetical protein KY362_05470 [Candidatus Woesearchaeota archaeon]|nr:hypothetical protein [Candidatus Woesearchaeota archaeon]